MKIIKVTLIAAVAIVGLGHAPAGAGKGVAAKSAGFNVSGVYTGTLSGTVMIGGEAIVLPKKVAIYDATKGMMTPSASVSGRSLYVSGFVRGNKNVAALIVILEPTSSQDFSQETLPGVLADPDRAR